ncbi:MAG: lyase family protein [Thermoplasmata archaeon]
MIRKCHQASSMYMELRQWHLEKHVISNFRKSDWKSDSLPKIWEGGGTEASDKYLTDVMTDEDTAIDSTLLDYEVINLLAFHVDLKKKGIIKEEESDSMLSALCSYLGRKIRVDPEEEDIHAYLENRIREAIGKSAENLRLFLSRNEQSQCNLRSFYVDHLLALAETLLKGSEKLRVIATGSKGKMPGFTHWRQAMPLAISTYYDYLSRILLDHSKDTILLIKKFRHFSPFGMGSGFGSFSSVSFNDIARDLGFENGPGNPVAASFYRGIDDLEVLSLISRMMVFYSRICADIIIYSSGSNPSLILPTAFLTGSSLMPNKRNPDFLEMVQGYTAQITADSAAISGIIANRNTGYHREFQISKDKAMRDLLLIESITGYMIQLLVEMKFDPVISSSSIENGSYSSYEAYKIFEKSGKWKESYKQTGEKVRSGELFSEYEPAAYESVSLHELTEFESHLSSIKNEWSGPRTKLIENVKSTFSNPD